MNQAVSWHGSFLQPIAHSRKKILEPPQIRVFSSGTLPQSLENFAAASGSRCKQNSVMFVVDDRTCWWHLYDYWRVVTVYYKLVSCNPVSLLLQFVVDLQFSLSLQLTRFWLTHHIAQSVCGSRASCGETIVVGITWTQLQSSLLLLWSSVESIFACLLDVAWLSSW